MGTDVLLPLRKFHGRMHEWILRRKRIRETKKHYLGQIQDKNNTVFLVLTPEHTNLGDHAIALAEIELLKSIGVEYVEITGEKLLDLRKQNLLGIMNGYPILINGGGNLGTLWFGVEKLMRDIVVNNPKSKIVILPNTIFYEDTPWGREELENSKQIYNKHKAVYMYARESSSYDLMKSAYKKVELIPDVVFSLCPQLKDNNRSGCLICLRNDCEKTLSTEQNVLIKQQIKGLFGDNYKHTDTHALNDVLIKDRVVELNKKWQEFASAELVITDRLHGMIFAAITGTPCIVINSKSPKVLGCYEWIKDLEYVKVATDITQITQVFHSIPKNEYKYDVRRFKKYFDKLKQDISEIVRGK